MSGLPSLFFVANRSASHGQAESYWNGLEQSLKRKEWPYAIAWTTSKNDTPGIVRNAMEQKPDIIISFGGDGTAHTMIQSVYTFRSLSPNTLFTVFPVGTGNDWVRYWKIPHKIEPWLDMIKVHRAYDHDLGQVEYTSDAGNLKTEYFNNVAGMAYDAYVADYIESKKKKMSVGGIQYLYFIFRCLFGYKLQASQLQWNGGDSKDKFYTINVGICPYSGGGIQIVPHAVPDDGLLAVTAVRPLNKFQVLLMSRHFYSGKLNKHKKAISFQTEELYVRPVETNEIIKLEAEGEYLGRLPARFNIIKRALKICAP